MQNTLQAMALKRITPCCLTGPPNPSPPGNASTQPARSRFPGFSGLLASLGARRSPGPPAPQIATFDNLPPDTLDIIAGKLSEGPRNRAAHNLAAAAMTNRALRKAVTANEHASRCLEQAQAPQVRNARRLLRELLYSWRPGKTAHLCMQALSLMNRDEQARLVQIVTAPVANDSSWTGPVPAQDALLGRLVSHLPDLYKSLRSELVEMAVGLADEEAIARTVGEFGGVLAHLDHTSIDRLVDKAIGLHDEGWRASAIGGLSRGWAHMNPDQRQRLWQAILNIQHEGHQDRAFTGLAAQLEHLFPDQRELVFNRVVRLPEVIGPPTPSTPVSDLAASFEVLDPDQRDILLELTCMYAEHWSERDPGKGELVACALAAHVKSMTPDQSRLLVRAIMKLGSGRAMAALGPGLAHVLPGEQEKLLKAAASWRPDAQAMAIAGFAAGMPHLEPDGRHGVENLALRLLGRPLLHEPQAMDWLLPVRPLADKWRAVMIGALGPHLKHLHEDVRDAVAEEALRLIDGMDRPAAFMPVEPEAGSPEIIRTLTEGLGAGMEALRLEQRDALAHAVASMSPHSSRRACDFKRLPAIAEAIAGLAAGRQYLSDNGVEDLSSAADNLKEERWRAHRAGATMGGAEMEYLQAMTMEATAVFGLAKD